MLIKKTTVHKDLAKHAQIHWKGLVEIRNGGYLKGGRHADARK
jgi:hypothetical protein